MLNQTIALFPGRFQPPHLGHILTLMDIYNDYKDIIIAVTNYTYEGKKPHVLPREEVKNILENVFEYLPNVEVVLTEEGFPVRKTFNDLPKFDIVVTGNHETIKNMKSLKIPVRYVPRTEGVGYTGETLRKYLNWSKNQEKVGVTIAIDLMKLGSTFKDMANLHQQEVDNHKRIRSNALAKAKQIGNEDPVYATILRLEAYRNLEHQKCHERMMVIYSGVE